MVTEKSVYITSDGRRFDNVKDAELREKIIDNLEVQKELKLEREELLEECQHTSTNLTTGLQEWYISQDDGSGGSCAVLDHYYRKGKCLVCGRQLTLKYDLNRNYIRTIAGW